MYGDLTVARSHNGRRRPFRSAVAAIIVTVAAFVVPIVAASAARADTAPAAGLPATVSDDPLPTVQINGVVWAQVVVGNTVYVTGQFTSARPAGSPLGTNETPRGNLLAYDITTGDLITSFDHSLNGLGRTITASPDGSRIYVGGSFSTVDGSPHYRIAAFDTASGTLVDSFQAGVDAGVFALTATNTTLYAGGGFSQANGTTRSRLAAFTTTGALTTWAPTANAPVNAMVMTPDASKVVVAGSFTALTGSTYYGLGALDSTTGKVQTWGSSSSAYQIQDHSANASITSLATDGTAIYLSAYSFGGGNFEGRASISPVDGHILWLNDCHGDSYGVWPVGQVLYSVSHAHECTPAGAFPQTGPQSTPATWTYHRALAETTFADPSGATDGPATYGYTSHQGVPRGDQLDWYPNLSIGSFTGQSQAAWSVTGNSDYISLGGEFPVVDGIAQQGLVRYAVSSKAPNLVGPKPYATTYPVTTTGVTANGTDTLSWPSTWDPDNAVLTYSLYRNNSDAPVYQTTLDTRFWTLPSMTWTDTGLTPGSEPVYRLIVTDAFGNSTRGGNLINDTSKLLTYTGSWTTSSVASAYAGNLHNTSVNGASVSLTYSGDSIAVVGPTVAGGATATVSIDGSTPTPISFAPPAGSSAAAQQNIYVTWGLSSGQHTIVITKTGGGTMSLDGIFAPGGGNAPVVPGKLTYSSTAAAFGSVANGATGTSTVTISNTGGTDVTISNVTAPAAPFAVTSPLTVGQVIAAGTSVTQTITYSPVVNGVNTGSYAITGTDGQGAVSIVLSGSSGQPTFVTINNNNAGLQYAGTWTYITGRTGDFQNDATYSSTNGASVTLPFTGTGASFSAEKYNIEGLVNVSIDGGAATSVNLYSASQQLQQTEFSVSNLANGPHTIKITKVSGSYLLIDSFTIAGTVTPAAPVNALNDNAAALTYAGSWARLTNRGAGDYKDDLSYTTANGASVTLAFTGTGVSFIAEKASWGGNVTISVDGGAATTVSEYSSSTLAQQTIFSASGLSNTAHTIKITKASGSDLAVDEFIVTGA